MSVSKAYSGIIRLKKQLTTQQFISHIFVSTQATRSLVKDKPPTVWVVISFKLTSVIG